MAVVRQFETKLAEDREIAWELIDPDVVVVDHDIPDAGDYRGHDGLAKWLTEDWGSAWESYTLEPEQLVDAGDTVLSIFTITAPPAFTKDAVFEALEHGIELIVIVTERIPRRDVAEMVELATAKNARIIGPNCLGVIVPNLIKMGGIGGPAKDAAKAYTPGPVGVMSRSGGMTTEISSTLTAAGLGQSTAVSIGGDAIIGSTYTELMPLFEADD